MSTTSSTSASQTADLAPTAQHQMGPYILATHQIPNGSKLHVDSCAQGVIVHLDLSPTRQRFGTRSSTRGTSWSAHKTDDGELMVAESICDRLGGDLNQQAWQALTEWQGGVIVSSNVKRSSSTSGRVDGEGESDSETLVQSMMDGTEPIEFDGETDASTLAESSMKESPKQVYNTLTVKSHTRIKGTSNAIFDITRLPFCHFWIDERGRGTLITSPQGLRYRFGEEHEDGQLGEATASSVMEHGYLSLFKTLDEESERPEVLDMSDKEWQALPSWEEGITFA